MTQPDMSDIVMKSVEDVVPKERIWLSSVHRNSTHNLHTVGGRKAWDCQGDRHLKPTNTDTHADHHPKLETHKHMIRYSK